MKRYDHYPGDYAKDTAGLTLTEHGAYRKLLDVYYATEKPIPDDRKFKIAGATTKKEREAVRVVLESFFGQKSGQWVHPRVEQEIEKYRARIDSAKSNGKRGGRPKKAESDNEDQNRTLSISETEKQTETKPNDKAKNKATGGGGGGSKLEEEESTPCPCPKAADMFPDLAVADIAKKLNVSEAAIREGVRLYVGFFHAGGGVNERRKPYEWRKSCRQALLNKSERGELVEPNSIDGVTLSV